MWIAGKIFQDRINILRNWWSPKRGIKKKFCVMAFPGTFFMQFRDIPNFWHFELSQCFFFFFPTLFRGSTLWQLIFFFFQIFLYRSLSAFCIFWHFFGFVFFQKFPGILRQCFFFNFYRGLSWDAEFFSISWFFASFTNFWSFSFIILTF